MVLFSSAEEKTSVGDDDLLEKNGTGWSSHVIAPDPVALDAEVSARWILSVMM